MCQMNSSVGDMSGNVLRIKSFLDDAAAFQPDIVAFPELALTGYPPEDLLLKPSFIDDNLRALQDVVRNAGDAVVIVGFVDRKEDIYNAAAVIYDRRIVDVYHKMNLPNYGVFDEMRYFQEGTRSPLYYLGDVVFGVTICEDIWLPEGPAPVQAIEGAGVIINITCSPYQFRKGCFREKMLSTRAWDNSAVIAYVNAVGGQDELVFDGQSVIIDQQGVTVGAGKQFEEDLVVADIDLDAVFMKRLHDPRRRRQAAARKGVAVERIVIPVHERPRPRVARDIPAAEEPIASLMPEEEVYRALVLGTRDYLVKNGFGKACVGLSGGIDSSLVAAIAADAVGRENVTGVFMPSRYTSSESGEDARELARNIGIEIIEIPIQRIFETYLDTLQQTFGDSPEDTTEENLQARIRGTVLMALSNKFGWIVLTTGNKSEMSVGYATLYGDMAGGFAVIKDVPKTFVYRLCRWKNAQPENPVIPQRVLDKPPSAELRLNQKDSDTLPPYEVLDKIITLYIEEDNDIDEIVRSGFDRETVQRVIRMMDTSEYKRRQAPPGVRISARGFGRDRRFPITNRYRKW